MGIKSKLLWGATGPGGKGRTGSQPGAGSETSMPEHPGPQAPEWEPSASQPPCTTTHGSRPWPQGRVMGRMQVCPVCLPRPQNIPTRETRLGSASLPPLP